MNLGELQTNVLRRLEEAQGSPVRWSIDDITDAINEGLEELADISEYYERYATFKLRKDASYYDLRSVIPDEILRVTAIYNPSNNTWLNQIDVRDIDNEGSQWEVIPGEPLNFFVRGTWWLGIYPSGPSNGGSVRVYYRAVPPRLTDTSQVPEQLPEDYHTALVDYAIYTLLADDVELTYAMRAWEDFNSTAQTLANKCVPGGRTQRARVGGMGRGVGRGGTYRVVT